MPHNKSASSKLHAQICRLSGARMMLAVRRRRAVGAAIRDEEIAALHAASRRTNYGRSDEDLPAMSGAIGSRSGRRGFGGHT